MALEIEIQKKAILKDSLSSKEYAELKIIVKYSTGGLESLLEISARLKKVTLGTTATQCTEKISKSL